MGIKEIIGKIKTDGLKKTVRDARSEAHYNTNAWYDVLSYDPDTKRYRLDRVTIKERDVPPYTLPVTGDNHHYFTTTCIAPKREIKREDGTYRTNAITNFLYWRSNPINKALEWLYKSRKVDLKALVIVGIGVAIVAYIIVSQGLI